MMNFKIMVQCTYQHMALEKLFHFLLVNYFFAKSKLIFQFREYIPQKGNLLCMVSTHHGDGSCFLLTFCSFAAVTSKIRFASKQLWQITASLRNSCNIWVRKQIAIHVWGCIFTFAFIRKMKKKSDCINRFVTIYAF